MTRPRNDKPDKREPYSFERTRVAAADAFAKEKAQAGKYPLEVTYTGFTEQGILRVGAPHADGNGHEMVRRHAFGTMSHDFASHQMGRVMAVMRNRGEDTPPESATNAALAAVDAVEPQNEIEAQLAVQMAGTHEVAMEMLTRAKLADTTDHLERYGTLATKLLRTYTTQVEALAKLRRGGSQKVVVEHVHVYQGGQAIVGQVTTGAPGEGGGQLENGHQPYGPTDPRALAFAPVSPLLREDAPRDTMSVARDEGKEAVPDTRRGRGKRRAQG